MISDEPEYAAEDEVSLDDVACSDDESDESDDLQAGSPNRGESIAATEAVTAERFYARLDHELQRRGVDLAKLQRLTPPGGTPPCFKLAGTNYDVWLASASLLGATVPYRYDRPAEPNYCWDCTPAFKGRAKKAGVCQFPGTRFERVQTVIRDEHKKVVEVEIVGISRRKHLTFEDSRIDELLT